MRFDAIRAWKPGDGITCSRAKTAPKDIPCGPPVAVWTQTVSMVRRAPATRTFVSCVNHLPVGPPASQMSVNAKKAAAEELIVEHWDRYQELLAEHAAREVDEMLQGLPGEIRALIASPEGVSA